jgi:hypothetical protein
MSALSKAMQPLEGFFPPVCHVLLRTLGSSNWLRPALERPQGRTVRAFLNIPSFFSGGLAPARVYEKHKYLKFKSHFVMTRNGNSSLWGHSRKMLSGIHL